MANSISFKDVVEHIVNGSFAEKLCLVCFTPLDEHCESVFTKVCTKDVEYSVADVLGQVFSIQVNENDNYNVCPNCFIGAFSVYKFNLQIKQSQEIINFYISELSMHIDSITDPKMDGEIVCIRVPVFTPETKDFDICLGTFASQYVNSNENSDFTVNGKDLDNLPIEFDADFIKNEIKQEIAESDGDILIVMNESKGPEYFKISNDANLVDVQIANDFVRKSKKPRLSRDSSKPYYYKKVKERKKRSPMAYIECSQCPIKYRFVSKLKDHMKSEHNIDLFVCKICKAMMEDENDFHSHLRTHTDIYVCAVCGVVLKKRDTMISHLMRHEDARRYESLEGAHVCEICGQILQDEEGLKQHNEKKHEKKHICFYCGRSYKGELSLEHHIKKHETLMKDSCYKYICEHCTKRFPSQGLLDIHLASEHSKKPVTCKTCHKTFNTQVLLREHVKLHTRNYHCEKCGRGFVDARALMWHQRLHNNERPYICDVCGRGFVSLNRRNQHSLCAHTAPSRRCPLCPALFHLRSMVNTHIRKVHLKAHQQRRNRCNKYQDVFWRTEIVPIQELSVAVQNELLELQTNDDQQHT